MNPVPRDGTANTDLDKPNMTQNPQRNFYHVGYGKAGSTTLQTLFFPRHEDIHFYGIRFYEDMTSEWPYESALNLIRNVVHPEYFEGFESQDLEELEQQKQHAADNDQAFVYSNDHYSLLISPEWSIGKMKELMPDAQILLVVRRQQDILKSIYKYKGKELSYVPRKYELSFVEFDEYFDYAHANFRNRGGHKARDWVADYFRIIDFNRLANFYSAAFGKENVHVFLFEDLASNPAKFYREMTSAMGISFDQNASYIVNSKAMNPSQNPAQIKYMSLKSKLFSNFMFSQRMPALKPVSNFIHKKLQNVQARDIQISQDQLGILSSIYAEGNRELSQNFNLDLETNGYLL